jgi:hypothetical protein
MVVDSIGQVKRISSASLRTLAGNGVSNGASGDSVILGGTLNRATTITQSAAKDSMTFATGGNKFKITGLPSGQRKDSIMTVDSLGQVKAIATSVLTNKGVVNFTTDLTVNNNDDIYIYEGTGNHTLTLPAASAANKGRIISIICLADTDGKILNLTPGIKSYYGTIETSISSDIAAGIGVGATIGNSVKIVSDGTKWVKIGN